MHDISGTSSAMSSGTTIRYGVASAREGAYDQLASNFIAYCNAYLSSIHKPHDLRYCRPYIDKKKKLIDNQPAPRGTWWYINELVRVNKTILFDDLSVATRNELFFYIYGDVAPPAGSGTDNITTEIWVTYTDV